MAKQAEGEKDKEAGEVFESRRGRGRETEEGNVGTRGGVRLVGVGLVGVWARVWVQVGSAVLCRVAPSSTVNLVG